MDTYCIYIHNMLNNVLTRIKIFVEFLRELFDDEGAVGNLFAI